MAITRLTSHDLHPVRIHITKPQSKHYAALRCVECNKHIQWLSRPETDRLIELGIESVRPWVTVKELGI